MITNTECTLRRGSGQARIMLAILVLALGVASVSFGQEKEAFAPHTPADWRIVYDSVVNAARPQIAYFQDEAGIFVVNDDGTNPRQLTFSPLDGSGHSFSPDGERLIFSRGGDLSVLEMATGIERSLGLRGRDPVWSPDGSMIVFNDGWERIVFTRPDGSTIKLLDLNYSVAPSNFSWSSDSKKVAFDDAGIGLHVLDAATMSVRKLTKQPPSGQGTADFSSPSWLQDGRIAYGYHLNPVGGAYRDSSVRSMTDTGVVKEDVLNGLVGNVHYLSSLPGSSLFAMRYADGRQSGIFTFDSNGSGLRLIVRDPSDGAVRNPSWCDPTKVKPKWDVNKDGVTDILDLSSVAREFGTASTGSADINGDGKVDISDIVLVALHFGERSDGMLASPALLEQREQILQRLKSGEDIKSILNDFIPEVKAKGKKAMTWGELKKP